MATKAKAGKAGSKALTPKQAAEAAGRAAADGAVKAMVTHMAGGGLAEVMRAAGREIADRVVQEVERREADNAPPFMALGYGPNGQYHYLATAMGQVVVFTPQEHDEGHLLTLAPRDWWEDRFPSPEGVAWVEAADYCMTECHRAQDAAVKVWGRYRVEAGSGGWARPYEWDDGPVGIGGERRMGETTDRMPGIEGGGISTPATGGNQAEQLRAAAEKLAAISQSVRIQAVRVRERLGVVPNEPPSLALDVKGGAYEGEGLIPMVLRVVAEATDELARAECALCDVTVALE